MPVSHFFGRALTIIDRVVAIVATIQLLALVVLVFTAVVMRYVFGQPLLFSFDLSTLLFAWVIFLGLAVADRDNAHMGLDVVSGLRPAWLHTGIVLLRQGVMLALALYLTWIGIKLFQRTGALIPSLRVSAKWLYVAMPIGFGLFSLSLAGRLARTLFRRKEA